MPSLPYYAASPPPPRTRSRTVHFEEPIFTPAYFTRRDSKRQRTDVHPESDDEGIDDYPYSSSHARKRYPSTHQQPSTHAEPGSPSYRPSKLLEKYNVWAPQDSVTLTPYRRWQEDQQELRQQKLRQQQHVGGDRHLRHHKQHKYDHERNDRITFRRGCDSDSDDDYDSELPSRDYIRSRMYQASRVPSRYYSDEEQYRRHRRPDRSDAYDDRFLPRRYSSSSPFSLSSSPSMSPPPSSSISSSYFPRASRLTWTDLDFDTRDYESRKERTRRKAAWVWEDERIGMGSG